MNAIELLDKWDEMTEPMLTVRPDVALKHADLMASELHSLLTEIEALRADAGRYRWLRKQHDCVEGDYLVVKLNGDFFEIKRTELDSTIDAAMEQAK